MEVPRRTGARCVASSSWEEWGRGSCDDCCGDEIIQTDTDASIMFGAPIHANLLVHEATHRYAKTVDAPVNVPSEG